MNPIVIPYFFDWRSGWSPLWIEPGVYFTPGHTHRFVTVGNGMSKGSIMLNRLSLNIRRFLAGWCYVAAFWPINLRCCCSNCSRSWSILARPLNERHSALSLGIRWALLMLIVSCRFKSLWPRLKISTKSRVAWRAIPYLVPLYLAVVSMKCLPCRFGDNPIALPLLTFSTQCRVSQPSFAMLVMSVIRSLSWVNKRWKNHNSASKRSASWSKKKRKRAQWLSHAKAKAVN